MNKDDVIIIKSSLKPNEYSLLALIQQKGEINTSSIGSVYYSINGNEASLDYIKVHKPFQGQGYGTMLLKEFEEHCRLAGVKKISGLFVPKDKDFARIFYTKNGYTVDRFINKTLDDPQA